MKKNIGNKIKTVAAVLCIILIATSFTSVAAFLSSSSEITDYETSNYEDKTVFLNDENNGDHVCVICSFEKPIAEKVLVGDTVYDTVTIKGASCGGLYSGR